MLKARVLRTHLVFQNLTLLTIQSIKSDLSDWYKELPEPMTLDALGDGTIDAATRRSLYHLHLLYLGAFVLIHRRICAQVLQSYWYGQDRNFALQPFEKLAHHAEEGILAASHSTKVLDMLLTEGLIFQRCWLVM
jgi:hypothetical protein